MPIPDYASCMLPLLNSLSGGAACDMRQVNNVLARQFGLSEEEENRLLPSGQMTYLYNRIGWAKTYLKMAGLIEYPSRGKMRITDQGRAVLAANPSSINHKLLMGFPSFVDFYRRQRGESVSDQGESDNDHVEVNPTTPDEAIESAYV